MAKSERWIFDDRPESAQATFGSSLKDEFNWTIRRYFAPVIAIYEQFEKTAGLPTAWARKSLDEDRRSDTK